ncbi:hypothetical protein ACOSP7_027652 [Xanthoceras sorbifolium]
MDDATTITKRLLADSNTPNTIEEINFLASTLIIIIITLFIITYCVNVNLCVLCLEMKTHKYQLLLGSVACMVAGAVVLCKHPKNKKKN